MKQHARAVAPEVYVPQTFWAGADIDELPQIELPDRWVIKPNHRSGIVAFGEGRAESGWLASTTLGWLDEVHDRFFGEWAYGQAKRQLLVEEFLSDEGESPRDYKFLVFNGTVRYVQVDTDRFSGHQRRLYTPAWEPLEVRNHHEYPLAPIQPAPLLLTEMLSIAEKIAAPFEFLRVDLYEVNARVAFGETTPYPDAGLGRMQPDSFDMQLGSMWQLPSNAKKDWPE